MKNTLVYDDVVIKEIIECIGKDLSTLPKFTDTGYFKSYFEFVQYFKNIDIIDYHSFVISAYFSYGWMPRVLKKFDIHDNEQSIINILNKVKRSIEITDDEYLCLVESIDNSIIGVSKLLHFISPEQYPIFDRRIKNYFKKNNLLKVIYKSNPYPKSKDLKDNKYKKDIQQYKIFRNLCLDIVSNPKFVDIYKESIKKLDLKKELTDIRVLENLFFYFGGNNDL